MKLPLIIAAAASLYAGTALAEQQPKPEQKPTIQQITQGWKTSGNKKSDTTIYQLATNQTQPDIDKDQQSALDLLSSGVIDAIVTEYVPFKDQKTQLADTANLKSARAYKQAYQLAQEKGIPIYGIFEHNQLSAIDKTIAKTMIYPYVGMGAILQDTFIELDKAPDLVKNTIQQAQDYAIMYNFTVKEINASKRLVADKELNRKVLRASLILYGNNYMKVRNGNMYTTVQKVAPNHKGILVLAHSESRSHIKHLLRDHKVITENQKNITKDQFLALYKAGKLNYEIIPPFMGAAQQDMQTFVELEKLLNGKQ